MRAVWAFKPYEDADYKNVCLLDSQRPKEMTVVCLVKHSKLMCYEVKKSCIDYKENLMDQRIKDRFRSKFPDITCFRYENTCLCLETKQGFNQLLEPENEKKRSRPLPTKVISWLQCCLELSLKELLCNQYNMPKTQKNKTEKISHPYSRKAMKEERRLLHKQRVNQGRQDRSTKLDVQAEKLRWFHDHLDDRSAYTKADLVEMVDQFRHRFDEELDQIAIVNSVGSRKTNQQHVSRETAIKFTMDMEKNEFESTGIEVPDLVKRDNLRNFRMWGGEMKYVQNFKMKKISIRDKEKVEDSFTGQEDGTSDMHQDTAKADILQVASETDISQDSEQADGTSWVVATNKSNLWQDKLLCTHAHVDSKLLDYRPSLICIYFGSSNNCLSQFHSWMTCSLVSVFNICSIVRWFSTNNTNQF